MAFKEYITNDIDAVFMNTAEFADTVKLDIGAGAREIVVIVDNEHLSHNKNAQELDRGTGDIFFYVNKSAFVDTFGRQPREGEAMRFNVKPCTVDKVSERNGVLEITLSYNVG